MLGQTRLCVKEKKTRRTREIKLGENFQKHITELYELLGSPDPQLFIFRNHYTGKPMTPQHINYVLKGLRFRYKIPVEHFSSHSIRKTFGRVVYDSLDNSLDAIAKLCLIFNHGDPKTTMAYLGIKQSEIDEVYNRVDVR